MALLFTTLYLIGYIYAQRRVGGAMILSHRERNAEVAESNERLLQEQLTFKTCVYGYCACHNCDTCGNREDHHAGGAYENLGVKKKFNWNKDDWLNRPEVEQDDNNYIRCIGGEAQACLNFKPRTDAKNSPHYVKEIKLDVEKPIKMLDITLFSMIQSIAYPVLLGIFLANKIGRGLHRRGYQWYVEPKRSSRALTNALEIDLDKEIEEL